MPAPSRHQLERREAIADILRAGPVATQGELVEALHARGLEATQSSVSRDLRTLGVLKDAGGYRLPSGEGAAAERELADAAPFVRRVTVAGANLVIIATAVGAAQRVAVALDRAGWADVVGTLSGDDTIFVATANATANRRLIARLRRLFPGV